jgi:aspartokinase-like uncharacterized kinase
MDKAYEELAKRWDLSISTSHRACALAQDQTGLILCDAAFSRSFEACKTMGEVVTALDANRVSVILPSVFIFLLNFIEESWDITSDGIAAWFAWLLKAKRFAILTDVDGIFESGKIDRPGSLLPEITSADLVKLGHTSVDVCTPHLLGECKMKCQVLNGLRWTWIKGWLEGRKVRGTVIL